MIDALRVMRFSFRDFWEDFVWLILLNLLWSVSLMLPAAPFLLIETWDLLWLLGASLVLLLPLPVVSGGLCYVANQASRGETVWWGVFVTGVRRYWAKSLVVAGVNLVVLVLIAANLQFYGVILQGTWTDFAFSAWLVVGIYWLLAQIFWFPMILEMEDERVILALRHALAMVIVTPGFSLTLGLTLALLGALCIALSLPAVVLMTSLFLLIFNHATRSRLAYARKEPYRPGVIDAD